MRYAILVLAIGALLIGGGAPSASAQLSLPQIGVPDQRGSLPPLSPLPSPLPEVERSARGLVNGGLERVRLDRIATLLREHPGRVELDRDKQIARAGVLIASGVDAAMLAKAEGAGFTLIDRERIEGLDLEIMRFRLPRGQSLARAQKRLAKLLPEAEVDADHLYFQSAGSGHAAGGALSGAALAMATPGGRASLGLIDGGVAKHAALSGRVEQRGFASGAPRPSAHGTAVASLMIGTGPVRGGAPGARLLAADVYGNDPAGGNASAIARALGWLAERGVAVTTISLVGPDNRLLGLAVRRAQRRGMLIVAAVGNDGPAAPPAYPAAWLGVLGVTGVDDKARALPEARVKSGVDFAAPGADMAAADEKGGVAAVRGTSFAAPLVAGRLARHYGAPDVQRIEPAVAALIAEAHDLGKKGRDKIYGHGLICGDCARR
ncbi:S8 family serine peptidase [Sphingopyxis sp. MWB1]|uniref:S8 family serine peptidase n=1 Tax=Sphingopyxis sp. MWB1 TaxID=1537715 RepID=UPI00051A8469|nr:S8 family serine peptidase [Sphingopyxis sp. MWB1]